MIISWIITRKSLPVFQLVFSPFGYLVLQGWLARADQPLGAASSQDVAAGGVLAVKWSGTLVAWAYDSSVSVRQGYVFVTGVGIVCVRVCVSGFRRCRTGD